MLISVVSKIKVYKLIKQILKKTLSVFFKPTKAFTLAEILITLGIIGVVAAIGIPSLVNNYQKREYASRFKKAYAEINQALSEMASDSGCSGDLVCTGYMHYNTRDTFGAELAKRFKVSKECGAYKQKGCMTNSAKPNYDGSGANINLDDYQDYKFMTVDGFSVMTLLYGDDCKQKWWTNSRTRQMQKYCGYITIDVNGPKKPNYYGRDIFKVAVTNYPGAGLYPFGGLDDRTDGIDRWWNGVNKTCYEGNKVGTYCAGRIVEQGWEMNY